MGHVLIEGIVACFIVLMACVVGIANGPVWLVCLYEKEVQQRVVERGLTTEACIRRSVRLFRLFGILPLFLFVMIAVYGINGARGFGEGFRQILVILLTEGLFDRLFIDWYWVGKTKAWIIPGTEDLMPYIYGKTLIAKWLLTLVGYPVFAAILAAVMNLILK
ncbi:MAG: hypothetical protein IKI45_01495 [Oscillospiraceae bacterium]|nr:hypothetical protein [Oscillospiraceae bacterium]